MSVGRPLQFQINKNGHCLAKLSIRLFVRLCSAWY